MKKVNVAMLGGSESSQTSALTMPNPFHKIGLALIPFSPAPLTGPDALYGWGRLALYSSLTYFAYKKSKKASYVLGGAAAISLFSSLSGKAWDNAKASEA